MATKKLSLKTGKSSLIPKKYLHFRWWLTPRKLLVIVTFIILGFWLGVERFQWKDLSANAFTELLGMFITVLVIDEINQKRSTEDEKRKLVLQMGSPNNDFAIEAVRQLDLHGWLRDRATLTNANLRGADLSHANLDSATLHKANLIEANLSSAILWWADLSSANLTGSNLTNTHLARSNLLNAVVTAEQLAKASSLFGAIMPNGEMYDGRYKIKADLERAIKEGYDINNLEQMNKFYEQFKNA